MKILDAEHELKIINNNFGNLGQLKNKKGIVPKSFLHIVVDCPNFKVKSSPNVKRKLFEVLYEFPGFTDGDLRAEIGDRIELIEQINDDWIRAFNDKTGKSGVVPIDFLSEISEPGKSGKNVFFGS